MNNFLNRLWNKLLKVKSSSLLKREEIDFRKNSKKLSSKEAVDLVWDYRMKELERRIKSLR